MQGLGTDAQIINKLYPGKIKRAGAASIKGMQFHAFACPYAATSADWWFLQSHPAVADNLTIHGFVYDPVKGTIHDVSPQGGGPNAPPGSQPNPATPKPPAAAKPPAAKPAAAKPAAAKSPPRTPAQSAAKRAAELPVGAIKKFKGLSGGVATVTITPVYKTVGGGPAKKKAVAAKRTGATNTRKSAAPDS